MAEYIDRDAAIAACFDGFADCRDDCAANIRNLPAADVVGRKLGSWRHYEGELTCSECAVTIYDDIMSLLGDDVPRFCPNCGARMIGGDEDV